MKVKLLKRMAGPDGNYPPGSVLDIDNALAKLLIAEGHAVPEKPAKKKR